MIGKVAVREDGVELFGLTRRGLVAFSVLLTVAVFSGALGLIAIVENHSNVRAIQAERLSSCQDQNGRNHRTVATLDARLAAAHITGTRAAGSRAFTVALIDALAPVQKCSKVIAVVSR